MKTQTILLIWIAVLSVLYSAMSIVRHNHFQSGGFDLGIYDQVAWQYANFQWPYNTIKDRFILGDHLTLTLPLLAPLFWLWEDVRILLIFQAVWISFSTLAIYKVAILRLTTKTRPRFDCQWTALFVSIVYSLFYGIQYLVYFDFHPVVIGVGLLAWIAYFLESGKTRWMIVSIVTLLLTQENMGLALAGLGMIYIVRFRRAALWLIIVGLLYSLAATRVIALFSRVGFEYHPQIPFDPWVILVRFFDHPEKRQVWWWSFALFSFLPLLSPGAVLAVISDLAQYFVTGDFFVQMWTPYKHHRAILGVFLALGSLDALVVFKRWQRYIAATMLGVALLLQYAWHLPLNKLVKAEYWKEDQWMRNNRALIATIPANAAIAAQQNFVPHLSHRNQMYLVWPRLHDFDEKPCGQIRCWWLDFDKRAQYLVVDTRSDQWLTQILETNDHWLEAIGNMEKLGRIKLENSVGSSRLYKIVVQ